MSLLNEVAAATKSLFPDYLPLPNKPRWVVKCPQSIRFTLKLNWIQQSLKTDEQEINALPMPTTSGLILVLQRSSFRLKFCQYVENHWLPTDSDSVVCPAEARKSPMNCIEFWTDVLDFKTIIPSSFQRYRAFCIFEKYIMHGAAKRVMQRCLHQLFISVKMYLLLGAVKYYGV